MTAAAKFIKEETVRIDDPEAVANVLRPILQDLKQESLFTVSVDSRNNILGIHECTRGLVNQCQAHAREIFRQAIIDNAARVVIAHNHPSGDPTPSKADIELTKMLFKAGEVVGITLNDHIIIGKKTEKRPIDFVSLHRLGLMK